MPPKAAPSRSKKPAGASWRQAAPAPVVLLKGSEDYLTHRARNSIRAALTGHHPNLSATTLDAATYLPGSLRGAAAPSLFGEPTLVTVENLHQLTEDAQEDILDYLKDPEPEATVLLLHGGGVRGKKTLDALKKHKVPEYDCQPLARDNDKLAFVHEEFKAHSRTIDPLAARALVLAVGSSTAELGSAVSQLLTDTEGMVTDTHIDAYYGGRAEVTAFKVADAAVQGRAAAALAGLRHALATGSDPVPMVAALAQRLRIMAKVSDTPGNPWETAKRLGIQGWQAEQAMKDLRGWTPEGLARSITAVAEADSSVKGGSRDPVYALEKAVGVICAAARGH